MYALILAVEYVVAGELAGDIVECGVWRGGSMMAVARTLLALLSRVIVSIFQFGIFHKGIYA